MYQPRTMVAKLNVGDSISGEEYGNYRHLLMWTYNNKDLRVIIRGLDKKNSYW